MYVQLVWLKLFACMNKRNQIQTTSIYSVLCFASQTQQVTFKNDQKHKSLLSSHGDMKNSCSARCSKHWWRQQSSSWWASGCRTSLCQWRGFCCHQSRRKCCSLGISRGRRRCYRPFGRAAWSIWKTGLSFYFNVTVRFYFRVVWMFLDFWWTLWPDLSHLVQSFSFVWSCPWHLNCFSVQGSAVEYDKFWPQMQLLLPSKMMALL